MASNTSTHSKPNTMRAWLYSSASGGLEHAIKLTDDAPQPPQPLPKDHVLVKVQSASLNPADYKLPEMGLLARAMISVPASPGMDFAGTVEKTGDAVDTFRVGEKVLGRVFGARFGALGEYVSAQVDGVASLPEGVSVEQGSCVGTAGLTAYQCIVSNVKEGDKIFINGGSGGTGSFGIQIAKAVGCTVTTSCSGKNIELCRSLGADEVIDYTKENVSEVLKGQGNIFKLVVDNVGTPTDLHKAADHFLLPEGKFVQIAGDMSLGSLKTTFTRMLQPAFLGGGKHKWEFPMTKNKPEDLAQIATWMKEGKVKVVIDEVFQYEDAPKAIEKLKTGRAKGKVVVRVSE
ncbi:Uu.00g035870.m01.CDS01 [Anthostomella pinea]|uniref:Uu.00g035870.m01.CDS01 n=1 Tax=Anthostomella pinea TaxID=933095 RepID=A0AAI8V9C2_9PEZI|nr:Uu.00g035870.m01.CDS01 [Anthostomella pinea]